MPRNGDKYRYITAAIPRNSQLYDELVADSADSGKSLADVMVLRLADYYRGKRSPQTRVAARTPLPEPQPVLAKARAQQEASVPRPATALTAAEANARQEYPASPALPPRQEEEIQVYDPKRAKNAAVAALANMDFGDE